MEKDYYKLLGVAKYATDDELRKAFKQISEAFFVLSDPEKRAIYDQHGEEVLKGQVPPLGACSPRSPKDNLSEAFGHTNLSNSEMEGSNGKTKEDISAEYFVSFSPCRNDGDRTGYVQTKASPMIRTMSCSLEELYMGITKKMKMSRIVLDSRRRPYSVEEVLTVDIKPGWKKGTRITFPERGNEKEGIIPADLILILDEKRHGVFERDDNDLIVTKKIGPTDVNTHVTTLDGRILTIPINCVIGPNREQVFKGEGMPIPEEPSKRGNLRIKMDI